MSRQRLIHNFQVYFSMLPSAIFIFIFILAILVILQRSFTVGAGFGLDTYLEILARKDYLLSFAKTAGVSFSVALLCIPLGIVCGLYLRHTRLPVAPLMALILVPWMVSVVVRTYGWMIILGDFGVVNNVLQSLGLTSMPVALLYNNIGVIVGLVHVMAPVMILAVAVPMLQGDDSFEKAAATLGASPGQTLFHVTLPLLVPGVVSGFIIVFLLTCGTVVTPVMLGGLRNTMVGNQIYQDIFGTYNLEKASAMSILLIIMLVASAIFYKSLEYTFKKFYHGARG